MSNDIELDNEIDHILDDFLDTCADSVICSDTDEYMTIDNGNWKGKGPAGYYRRQIKALIAKESAKAVEANESNQSYPFAPTYAFLHGHDKELLDELDEAVAEWKAAQLTDTNNTQEEDNHAE